MNKRKNKKKGFTLVELLAVIVILAIILVIAVPKVISIIDDTKKGTLESTAKMIASAAEKAKVQNAVLGKDDVITCESVVKLNNVDYERCNIEFIDNKAHVDIKGSGKFENMYVCKGTKDEAHIVNRCPNEKVMVELQPNTEEQFNNISGIYKEGEVIYLDTPTKTDFTFIRWEVVIGDSILEDGNKLTVGEFDTIVYAVWENNPSFEVVLDGGVDNIDYKERYQTRTVIDLEVPTKTNYKFIRWEKVSGDGVLSGNTYTMGTEDTVIKAIWELNVFNLTVEPNGGTITQEFKSEYAVGETIILEPPTRIGYTFTGWTVTNGNVNDNIFTMGTANAILTANWKVNTYNITYELDSGTSSSSNPTNGEYGSTVTINNPTRTGYTFNGWTVSGIGALMSGTSLTIGAADVTLTAKWRINKVYFKFHVNGGTVTESTTSNDKTYSWTTSSSIIARNGIQTFYSINYGETDNLPNYNNESYLNITKSGAIAKSGAQWICSSGCTTANNAYDHSVTYNASDFCNAANGDCTVTLKVNWQNVYTIKYNLDGGELGSSAPTSGTTGQTLTISNPTKANYTFEGWKVSGTGASLSGKTLTVGTGNITLTAKWEVQYLYSAGNESSDTTGGWRGFGWGTDSAAGAENVYLTRNSSNIKMTFSNNNRRGGVLTTEEKVNLSNVSTITFNGYIYPSTGTTTSKTAYGYLFISEDFSKTVNGASSGRRVSLPTGSSSSSVSLDVSGYSGDWYICVWMYTYDSASPYLIMNSLKLS